MTAQHLMPFEAETVAAETLARAARTAAEQHEREVKAAAKLIVIRQREQRKTPALVLRAPDRAKIMRPLT